MRKRAVINAKHLERFRGVLLAKRQALVEEVGKVERDLEQIAGDREAELEESAQESRFARLLARLDDRGMTELGEIEGALARLRDGEYGNCVACGEPIPLARLDAIPETLYCRDCAADAERHSLTGAEEGSAGESRKPGVPPDYSNLSDPELEEAIRELLRDDRRVDMEELRIVCRRGVVYLGGSVPSEGEHQIVLQTITDVMGLKEVDDRLQAQEMLWEREDRSREDVSPVVAPWEESGGTEDVTEAQEDGVDFEAPIRPIPEEE
ncbi:MAG: transcriptional regulator, TraR/DksA family [Deltaproteobacteria bacterium]|nr:transcriptional regulator, TraR/DksA family [Deltaproteobacteria bacterium]